VTKPYLWTKCHLGGRRPWFNAQTIIKVRFVAGALQSFTRRAFELSAMPGVCYESQRGDSPKTRRAPGTGRSR